MNAITRVAVVDDHALVAEALSLSLSPKGFEVLTIPVSGIRPEAGPLLAAILQAGVDVVLLDLDLGAAGDGTRLIQPLARSHQRVIVLTGTNDPTHWGACLAQGATTVLSKTSPLPRIADAIQSAVAGRPVMSPAQRDDLIMRWSMRSSNHDDRRKRLGSLTPREAQVLAELMHGKRVREVAKDAFVSEATVRTQVKSILAKLGVNSQLAAVAMARDAGWRSQRRSA
jgi:DNA-binding NarL/FixJ family response regulator